VNHLFFTCKIDSNVWHMTDAWTDRLFVHCDRAEHIGIMETNNLGNNM